MHLPGKRAVLEKLLLIAFGLLIAFILLELGLRLVVWMSPEQQPLPTIVEFDPELGWSYIPKANGFEIEPTFFDNGKIVNSNRLIDININGFGFRDDEWQINKPAGKERIAFLGDSFVFGHGLHKENRFSDLVESDGCESLNFGVSGYSTDQELLLARKTVFGFEPDVIVLGIFLGNDVEDNAVPLPANTKRAKPYFTLEENGLVLQNSPLQKDGPAQEKRQSYFLLELKRWLNQNIYSYSFLVSLLKGIPLTNGLIVSVEKTRDFRPYLDLTIALVEELGKEAESRNAKLLVLFFPSPNQLYKSDDKRNGWSLYLAEGLSEKGIPSIDFFAEFKKHPEEQFYFVANEHLDSSGNIKVASILRQNPLLSDC